MKILQLIKSNPRISKREMAENMGISTTTIDKHIKKLREKGFITRKGSDRTGFWKLIDKK